MSTHKWSAKLKDVHAQSLPLIISSLLCVQLLAAARDPIVIGWDLPFWLVLLNAALIILNIGLVLWVRADTMPKALIYPVAAFAFICTGLKAIASIVVQAEALPLYLAVVMLAGSLCFLSIRYLVFSMSLLIATWVLVAPSVFSTGEIVPTLLITVLGAALSIFILRRRLAAIIKVFELEQRVVTLESILPMCANCKKTRDHTGNWQSIEEYIEDNQDGTQISHGSCPACTEELYGDYLKKRRAGSTND